MQQETFDAQRALKQTFLFLTYAFVLGAILCIMFCCLPLRKTAKPIIY